jgi:hypothetical protein
MPVSRRTRVEHDKPCDKPISRVQNIIKKVGIGPKGVFIAANLTLLGKIPIDREWGYFQKFVSPEVVPYTDGIALSSTLQLAQDNHRSILLL